MERTKTILIIEDALPIRQLLRDILKTRGFEVFDCQDGIAALEAAAKNIFDVIITDYRMPNMNGVEATKHLRERFPESTIIGVSSDDMRRAFLAAGADAFLLKPYRVSDLLGLMAAKQRQ